MSETFNSSEGRRVVAADTAERIGEVKGFVVDPTATRIASVHIAGRGKKAKSIPWASIRSFGADAVMVDLADSVERVSSEHVTHVSQGTIIARNTRVLDTDGFEQGTVEDVMFDAATGELTGALTKQGLLDGSRFRSLGSYALIIESR